MITPPILEIERGFAGGGHPLPPAILRQYVLYWDEIVLISVQNPFVGTSQNLDEVDPDVKLVRDAGVFKYCNVGVPHKPSWHSEEVAPLFSRAQQEVAAALSKGHDGHWSIGQTVGRLELPPDQSSTASVLVTKLNGALPVPGEDVPVEDVLRFKDRRSDEFAAFRGAYDDLYLSVLREGDQHLALVRAVERIERAIVDVTAAMSEATLKPRGATLTTLWNVGLAASGAALTMTELFKAPAIAALAAAAYQAGISLKSALEQKPTALPDSVRDYAYLSHVKAELSSTPDVP